MATSPTDKIAKITRRQRERHPPPRRRTRELGPDLAGLGLWTDGVDIFIARDAAEAEALAVDPLDDEERAEFAQPPDAWRRLLDDPLELLVEGVARSLPQRTWIALNYGHALLAVDGYVLERGRRAA